MTPLIRAVIFDLDGCLVDSETMAIGAIAQEMSDMGMSGVTFDEIRARFLGVSMRVIFDYAAQQTGETSREDFIMRVEARLFKDYQDNLRRFSGVKKMLKALRNNGLLVAIATGGSIRRMNETLSHSDLADWFDGVAFSADQVEQGKPAPDIFLFAAQNLGVLPAECIVFEDSPHGVEGAVAAGMQAVGFVGGSHLEGIREAHTALLREKGAVSVVSDMAGATKALLYPFPWGGSKTRPRNIS
ncbi:MAG: HAD family phosphatase [Rhodobacteraceae bacterium]|nr:HAD family phosphatase [Paracoccaceae bacterium]PHR53624.1 MAG: hypothetical protein COA47_16670 [Robiginitomaculum sp.]